jgi:signal transduction histidine kinase
MKDELIQKSTKNVIYVINEIRQLSRSLMNPSLGDLGLLDSINDLIENINLTRKLHVVLTAPEGLEELLDEQQKLTIFRIVQEALNNAIKHAKATTVQLKLKRDASNMVLKICDDGTGFDPATVRRGSGLKNIQNRVYLSDATFAIKSKPGKGCKLEIKFPINSIKTT